MIPQSKRIGTNLPETIKLYCQQQIKDRSIEQMDRNMVPSVMMKLPENGRIPPGNIPKPLVISSGSKTIGSTTSMKASVPPKPVPPKPVFGRSQSWRPRSGSAGSNNYNLSIQLLPPVLEQPHLEKPYKLERSSSDSHPKPHPVTPDSSPTTSTHPSGARARSFSSSAVTPTSSDGSPSSRETMNSLLSNLSMRRHKYGDTHPKVGSAWNRIGNFFFRACQYEHALNAFKHAVACYPVGEADLACTYSNLGVTYWASGGEGAADQGMLFLQKAMDLYEIHAIAAGGDPENSISVATVLYQMGLCQTLRKQHNDALTCLKKCQKIQGTLLGPRDIQVGRTLDAIGKVHFFKGEYSIAMECHEEARRIKAAASGPHDAAVVASLLNIAAVHQATKNWTAALGKYTKALQMQMSELVRLRNQKEPPLLARAAQEVGETMQLMGDMHLHMMEKKEKAKRFYREASLFYQEAGLDEGDPRMRALKKHVGHSFIAEV